MGSTVTGFATPIPPRPASGEAATRLRRLRALAWFLDRSIPIGKYRIGLDPILGLIPGLGDWLGGLLSLYVFYEGARLGMPTRVLGKMAGNILVETLVGAIPVLGDIFDFAWQSNARNLALIERHYSPQLRPRPLRSLAVVLLLALLFVLTLIAGLFVLLFKLISAAVNL